MERVVVYIDGFNLYYGLKTKGWKRFYWLNMQKLAENILKSDQHLITVKYFTARISGSDKDKQKRQNVFLEALGTLSNFNVYYGHYLEKTTTCFKCKNIFNTHEEKMTDVYISTEMLLDAFKDIFDTAILVSGDSDLVPPIEAIRNQFPEKGVVVAFPPERISMRLKQSANAYFIIGKSKLRKSIFPEEIMKPDGYLLKRPKEWK